MTEVSGVMAKAAVTLDAVIAWFTDYQNNHIMKDGVIPKWFHGNISRKQAEKTLMTKPPGFFLIRVSESRIGYTLSYRAEDVCRHFMIDVLPGNRCVIVGENLQHYSLHDLVAFHRRTPIPPYTELLTVASDQDDENISEDPPPALPVRSWVSHPLNPNQDQSISPSGSISPTSLYPNLEQELSALSLDSVVSPLNPAPQPRPNFILAPSEITTRSQSAHDKPTIVEEQSTSLPTTCKQRKSEHTVQQKCQKESKHTRIGLIQCRNIFKKKKNYSEDHTYMEIDEAKVTMEAAKKDHQEEDGAPGTLPLEYLHPPPFAPGY